MSYEPTNWKSGDVVTSAKLNKMEQGIANAGGALILTNTAGTLNKTWQEIHDAAPLVWVEDDGGYMALGAAYEDNGDYVVSFVEVQADGNNFPTFIAAAADDYPVVSQ